MRRFLLTALALAGLLTPARADVRPAPIFANGMVLQRDMPVPIWGTAAAEEEVTVSFLGQKKTAKADAKGKWKVTLDKLSAGGPHELTVAGKNEVKLTNVLVGEVWLCSGQSNMVWTLKQSENAEKEASSADLPKVRLSRAAGPWAECSPKTAPGFSACAYYFGRDLHRELKVPIGLVVRAVGGTSARLWTSSETVETDETLAPFKKDILEGQVGKDKKPVRNTGILYNQHIRPLEGFAIRGTIWYQGESDAARPEEYAALFPAMIRSWRKAWGQGDTPFLFVQLAPIKGRGNWGPIREAQAGTLALPATAMVVITDGDADIHPKKKQLPGTRLALAARAVAYGEKVEYAGPTFASQKIDGERVTLSFKHVGGGLAVRGDKLIGFTVVDAAGKEHAAEAAIEGETVVVTAKGVKPVGVRYAFTSLAEGTLINKERLPASPFRSVKK
jgi:sialate O-acetylesterase